MQKERSLKTLTLDGGAQPFHFINTVYAWRGQNLHEYLNDYTDVLTWCGKVALLKKETIQQLKTIAEAHPVAAKKASQKMLDVRALLYHFFSAIASNNKPALAQWLPALNKHVHEALTHFDWAPSKNGVQFVHPEAPSLLLPLWVVLKAAHDMLLNGDPHRIKECPRCGWIFIDTTKNGKRRWCNPQDCGSIDKANRYYHNKVKAQPS